MFSCTLIFAHCSLAANSYIAALFVPWTNQLRAVFNAKMILPATRKVAKTVVFVGTCPSICENPLTIMTKSAKCGFEPAILIKLLLPD